MNGRRLNDDERALWSGMTRSIAPLRKPARKELEQPAADPDVASHRGGAAAPPPPLRGRVREGGATAEKSVAAAPPLAPLGRRFKQRIARGMRAIDGRLDLHGMTQARAHDALLGFLRTTQARGGKVALVITGKGGGDSFGERGVLRRQVPQWLRLAEFRRYVVGFEPAGPAHGGEGALYVRLRSAQSR